MAKKQRPRIIEKLENSTFEVVAKLRKLNSDGFKLRLFKKGVSHG